jgi:hypothetical protein
MTTGEYIIDIDILNKLARDGWEFTGCLTKWGGIFKRTINEHS